MKKVKMAVLEAPVTINVTVEERATAFSFGEAGDDLQPLFYRKAEYMLPAYVVQTPMPTLTCRHLEKATIHLMQRRDDQALLAFKRAVASGIEPMTLIKVALACHTEGYREEAEAALLRAVKYSRKDDRSRALVSAIAGHLGYAI